MTSNCNYGIMFSFALLNAQMTLSEKIISFRTLSGGQMRCYLVVTNWLFLGEFSIEEASRNAAKDLQKLLKNWKYGK